MRKYEKFIVTPCLYPGGPTNLVVVKIQFEVVFIISEMCAFIFVNYFCEVFLPCSKQGYSRTRDLYSEELLEQLPALQQLLYCLVGCRVIF